MSIHGEVDGIRSLVQLQFQGCTPIGVSASVGGFDSASTQVTYSMTNYSANAATWDVNSATLGTTNKVLAGLIADLAAKGLLNRATSDGS